MLFSIIVPIYNVEKYIRKCVDSLCRQTYRNIEIVLVDDGSPDQCPIICDEYAQRDERIRVIHKENGGLSDARNKGLENANGEYVMFVDGDDYIEMDACEKLEHYMHEEIEILIGDAIVEGGKNYLQHALVKNQSMCGCDFLKQGYLCGKMPMAVWLNVYNRKFLLDNHLFFKCGILHEDEQFTPRAFLQAKTVIYTGVEFYHYIVRENSITTRKNKRKNMIDFYGTCQELENCYRKIDDETLRKLLLNSLVDKYLSLFQSANLIKYGSQFVHKDFVKRNAYTGRTKKKSMLFRLSPALYVKINCLSKIFIKN